MTAITIIIDFETTGLSPRYGDRTIEVGAVKIADNRIIDRYQSLMNPGQRVSPFIEEFTGISNAMLATAPACREVMTELHEFIGRHPLVAHNASFDSRFLDAEFERIGLSRGNQFACSMLAARRLYPDAPDHRLETLVRYKQLKSSGVYHRALADAEMTAELWLRMIADITAQYGLQQVPFPLLQQLSKISRKKLPEFMAQQRCQA